MNVNLRALIGKLNDESKAAVEAAAGLCLGRTHYDVEVEHYLMKVLDQSDGDIAAILKHYGIDRSRLEGADPGFVGRDGLVVRRLPGDRG